MATQDQATSEAPTRRRPNWSIRTIVENVAGHPISHFQDPPQSLPRPAAAGPVAVLAAPPAPASASSAHQVAEPDPVDAVYPPLIGELGREYHGVAHEHHAETLARHRSGREDGPGGGRSPGPLARPERIYLHYLLLHMDRLSDTALVYLGHAVEEERVHRSGPKHPTSPG